MKKVLIPTKLNCVASEILHSHGGYEVVQDASSDLAELVRTHGDAYALIVRSEKVSAAIIDALPSLKIVVRAGAGYNTIDTRHARRRGVDVMNTPGANANAVAEEVVALMLADARHLIPADASTRAGKWEKATFMGRELAGKTVGIVGLGHIGRLVAKRLRGFECRMLGYDPLISKERAREGGVETVSLEELFAESDYITLHIPENDETRGLIGERLLGLAKDGATIVNGARAGILDEAAFRALKAAKSLKLLTDVYPKDGAGEKSVADIADIMLPHLGASTAEANGNAASRAAQQIIDLDDKGVTSFIVNRDIPDGLDEQYCELSYALARLCRHLGGAAAPLTMMETSFYGQLEPFAPWLLVPVVAGIWSEFDRTLDHDAALAYLKEMGIEYVNRDADSEKRFENSITIDLIAEQGGDQLRRTSVRGTVAEGILMVARINEFDRLYFEPSGPTLFFIYDDRPGVIAVISRSLAAASVNIEDMRNPHDSRTNRSLAILKVSETLSGEQMAKIAGEIGAVSHMCMDICVGKVGKVGELGKLQVGTLGSWRVGKWEGRWLR